MSNVLLCQGTALALPFKDASVHTCVTSPPYFGLRDYHTGAWQGGDAACTHVQTSLKPSPHSTLSAHGDDGRSPYLDTLPGIPYRGVCGRCGATRVDAQLGLEASVEDYVAAMVQVFREVKRVLRPEGTLWLNMGDSYIGSANAGGETTRTCHGAPNARDRNLPTKRAAGLQPKNLLGMPWRLAFALQADGWILRSDIIWDKPSCMPESVQDRPTRSHEYIFLFSKQARYHYDATAVRETGGNGWHGSSFMSGHDIATKPGLGQQPREEQPGRNCRTVWRIASESTSFAHFATFPQALVRRCLLAGAPTQVCRQCGAPWKREVEREPLGHAVSATKFGDSMSAGRLAGSRQAYRAYGLESPPTPITTGFTPTCACQHASMPATVLDPFCGSGTTLFVARELGHHAVGIDLSAEYLRNIARVRLGLTALKAWQEGAAPRQDRYDDLPLFAT